MGTLVSPPLRITSKMEIFRRAVNGKTVPLWNQFGNKMQVSGMILVIGEAGVMELLQLQSNPSKIIQVEMCPPRWRTSLMIGEDGAPKKQMTRSLYMENQSRRP
jgi:hypothetical protein